MKTPISISETGKAARVLCDTNVISEARNGANANSGVQKFFKAIDAADLYVAAQSIGEIRRGLENIRHRGDLPQAKRLEKWLDLVADDCR